MKAYFFRKTIYRLLKHGSVLSVVLFISLLFSLFCYVPAYGGELSPVAVKIVGAEMSASAVLTPEKKFVDDVNAGMPKELVFYVDLFKVWNVWPDEFITGKKVVKTLKVDPIKREYTATSLDGNVHIEKKFRDSAAMLTWTMTIAELKLANTKTLTPGVYYVKVSVESKSKKLPAVLGYMLFFVSENEFNTTRNSTVFTILPDKQQ